MKLFGLAIAAVLIAASSKALATAAGPSASVDQVRTPFIPTLADLDGIQSHFLFDRIKTRMVPSPIKDGVNMPYFRVVFEATVTRMPGLVNRCYWMGMHLMIDRTYRYAFLLTVYAYETLKHGEKLAHLLAPIERAAGKLIRTLDQMKFDKVDDLRDDIRDLTTLGGTCTSALARIRTAMNRHIVYYIGTKEIIPPLNTFKYFSAYLRDQKIKLPQDALIKILWGFPTARSVHDYNFPRVPRTVSESVAKLSAIFEFIDKEYLIDATVKL